MSKPCGCHGGVRLFQPKRIPSKSRSSSGVRAERIAPRSLWREVEIPVGGKFLKQTLHFGRRSCTESRMGLASASARVRGIEGREGNRSEFAWVEVLVIQIAISHDVEGIFLPVGQAGQLTMLVTGEDKIHSALTQRPQRPLSAPFICSKIRPRATPIFDRDKSPPRILREWL